MRNHFFISIMALLLSLVSGKGVCARTWVQLDGSEGKPLTTEVLQSDLNVHKVRMTIHGFYDDRIVIDGTEYHQPYLDMYEWLMYEGEPQLPTLHQTIAVPEGADFKVTITEEKWTDVEIGKIYPAQKDVKECDPEPPFTIKENTYHQEVYAPFLVTTGKEWNWCNIRGNTVHVCPFRYHPLENRLSVLTDFVLKIEFTECSDKSPVLERDLRRAIDWHMFDNDISGFPVKSNMAKSSSDEYDYLIIVGNIPSILNSQALQDFTKWKAFKGYKTKVVSTTTIGATANDIKNYIAQEEYLYGIKYVLLIGDYDKIPLKELQIVTTSTQTVYSDYWYGCLGSNGNFSAKIPVGRFSTNTLSDFENMVNKTISYEKSYEGNYRNNLLVAHKGSPTAVYNICCDQIYDSHSSQLDFTKIYGFNSGSTNAQVVSKINNGSHIVNYRGHGDIDSWGYIDSVYNDYQEWNIYHELFKDSQIASISTKSIYFNICCKTGSIFSTPCMMETFLRSQNGAIACLAATVNIWRFAGNKYDKNLFNKLLDDNIWHIGDVSLQSHVEAISTNDNNKEILNALAFICGGDPTLEIWTGAPCSYTNVNTVWSNNSLTIYSPSFSLNDKISIVSEAGELINVLESSGTASTIYPPADKFYVVINRHNYYPYIIHCNTSGYIQNETIGEDLYFATTPLDIGYNVTTDDTFGNVTVKTGAKLLIQNVTGGVTFKNGYECEAGAEIVVQ